MDYLSPNLIFQNLEKYAKTEIYFFRFNTQAHKTTQIPTQQPVLTNTMEQ